MTTSASDGATSSGAGGKAPRRILHLDMDAFFAAVELLRRPDLKGRPVVIGGRGDPTRRGVVSTATYEARAYGVRSGMPLRTALKLCPTAVFIAVDFEEYHRYSAMFKAVPLVIAGASFTSVTVTAMDCSSNILPSEARTKTS